MTRSHTFSRAFCRLHVFVLSFDWFTGLSVYFVIGQESDTFSRPSCWLNELGLSVNWFTG